MTKKRTPEELEAIRGRCEKATPKPFEHFMDAYREDVPALFDHISALEAERDCEYQSGFRAQKIVIRTLRAEKDALAERVKLLESSKDASLAFAQARKIAMLEAELAETKKALGEERAARPEKKVLEAKLADALQANKEVYLRERVAVWVRKCEELEAKLAQERDDVFRQLGESQNLVKELGDKLADHNWCKLAHGLALGEEVALRVKAEAERDALESHLQKANSAAADMAHELAKAERERDALAGTVEKMRAAVSKDRVMFITKREIEDGCFNPDRSKDCACRIREQLRKEILADIDALIATADKPQACVNFQRGSCLSPSGSAEQSVVCKFQGREHECRWFDPEPQGEPK